MSVPNQPPATRSHPHPFRRADDDELTGFVRAGGEVWESLTVFGGVLGVQASEGQAREHALNHELRRTLPPVPVVHNAAVSSQCAGAL